MSMREQQIRWLERRLARAEELMNATGGIAALGRQMLRHDARIIRDILECLAADPAVSVRDALAAHSFFWTVFRDEINQLQAAGDEWLPPGG